VWPRLAAAIGQALVVVDEGGRVQAMNAAGYRDLGVGGSDVIGRRLDDLLEVTWPEAHEPPFALVCGRRTRVLPGPRSGWRLLLIEEGEAQVPAVASAPLQPQLEPVVDVVSGERLACAVVFPSPAKRCDAEAAATMDARALRCALEALAAGRAVGVCVSLCSVPDAAMVARVRAELMRSAVSATLLEVGFDAVSLALADDGGDAALDALRALGVRTALDDVGAAPFALAPLAAGRIDVVRLSPSLVQALAHEEHAEALIEGIAGLAAGFRAEVRVCGIRNAAERDFLAALGCTQQQGPLFAQDA
jgi:hypothetical protein